MGADESVGSFPGGPGESVTTSTRLYADLNGWMWDFGGVEQLHLWLGAQQTVTFDLGATALH